MFATCDIAAGTVLGRYRSRPTREEGPFTIWSADGSRAEEVTCRFRYVNHSDQPNVAYLDDRQVVTLAAIPAGAELTLDYSGGA